VSAEEIIPAFPELRTVIQILSMVRPKLCSEDELARRTGVSQATISRLVGNRRRKKTSIPAWERRVSYEEVMKVTKALFEEKLRTDGEGYRYPSWLVVGKNGKIRVMTFEKQVSTQASLISKPEESQQGRKGLRR
jgi:transcriptional regulator with XRE-family HTH domain